MFQKKIKGNLIKIAFFFSTMSVVGSLYFSEILGYFPCNLCWWQRIFMYPLVVILGIGISRKDKSVSYYALSLSALGLLIAFYHNLIYYGLVVQNIISCVPGVSCTEKYTTLFGFLSIPLMSLISFVVIVLCLIGSLNLPMNKTQTES